jgi:hypothetical protein
MREPNKPSGMSTTSVDPFAGEKLRRQENISAQEIHLASRPSRGLARSKLRKAADRRLSSDSAGSKGRPAHSGGKNQETAAAPKDTRKPAPAMKIAE